MLVLGEVLPIYDHQESERSWVRGESFISFIMPHGLNIVLPILRMEN